MKTHNLLTIKAEDRPGLIHLITGMIEKKQIKIESISAAQTDIHEIMMVTVEVSATERELTSLAFKLENIVEVYAVEVQAYDQVLCLRAAYFKMTKSFLETPKVSLLNKYSAVIINVCPETILVAKYGTDLAIRTLYNELEGPHLLGFSQTGLISESNLIGDEQSSVIRLAA